jgi:hypothetical protein
MAAWRQVKSTDSQRGTWCPHRECRKIARSLAAAVADGARGKAISDERVEAIRAEYFDRNSTRSIAELAAQIGLSSQTVHNYLGPRGARVAMTAERRVAMGAKKVGKKRSPETVAKMSAAARGKKPTAETREKIAAATRARHARKRAARSAPAGQMEMGPAENAEPATRLKSVAALGKTQYVSA